MWGRKFPRIMELAIVAGGIIGARVSYFKSPFQLLTRFGGELPIRTSYRRSPGSSFAGPLVQVFPLPRSRAQTELKPRKALFEFFQFSAFPARSGVVGGKFLQVNSHEPRERGMAFDGDPPGFLDQVLVNGKGNVH